MGATRNGARTLLSLIQKACRLSHLPGFRNGILKILGEPDGTGFLAVWDPLCTFVDQLLALDDWFNKRDATQPDDEGSEDGPFG